MEQVRGDTVCLAAFALGKSMVDLGLGHDSDGQFRLCKAIVQVRFIHVELKLFVKSALFQQDAPTEGHVRAFCFGKGDNFGITQMHIHMLAQRINRPTRPLKADPVAPDHKTARPDGPA